MHEVFRTPAYVARAALAGEDIWVQQCLVDPVCSLVWGHNRLWQCILVHAAVALQVPYGGELDGNNGTSGFFDLGEFPGEFPQLPDFSMQTLSFIVQNMIL